MSAGFAASFIIAFAPQPRQRDDASIVPYKSFAAFITIGKVSLRRDEGIPPYRMMADIDKYKMTPPAAFHAVMRDCLSREFSCLSLIDLSGQYRIILSADTASEVRQMLSQKRR